MLNQPPLHDDSRQTKERSFFTRRHPSIFRRRAQALHLGQFQIEFMHQECGLPGVWAARNVGCQE